MKEKTNNGQGSTNRDVHDPDKSALTHLEKLKEQQLYPIGKRGEVVTVTVPWDYKEIICRKVCQAILKDDAENTRYGDAQRYHLMCHNIRKGLNEKKKHKK